MRSPRISVITPSYNQAQFLDRTIRSVIEQGFTDCEHIVMDGGSTDGSVDIIRRYADQLTYWVSERDNGQSHAINKGFAKASGEILCWLNSDDFYEPLTLPFVADYFTRNPHIDVLCGGVRMVDPTGATIYTLEGRYDGRRQLVEYWRGYHMHQPSIFWRRHVYDLLGGLDERLYLTMDFDYWLRISNRFRFAVADQVLSSVTMHPAQKTAGNFNGYRRAQLRLVLKRFGSPLAIADWDIRFAIYAHVLRTVAKLALGRKTCY